MKRSCVFALALAGSLAACAGASRAQTCTNCAVVCSSNFRTIQRWFYSTGGCTPPCGALFPCPQCNNAGVQAFVQLNSCVRRVNVFSHSTLGSTGPIAFPHSAGNVPTLLEVFIGEGDFPYSGAQSPVEAIDIPEIDMSEEARAVTVFAGHISGDLGPTLTGKVYRLDVDGSIGLLEMTDSPGAGFPQIFAGSTLASTTILCENGSIDTLSISGDALGDISAPGGGIDTLLAGNLRGDVTARDFIEIIDATGAIATSGGAAISIDTTGANEPIGLIEAASINANIDAGLPRRAATSARSGPRRATSSAPSSRGTWRTRRRACP